MRIFRGKQKLLVFLHSVKGEIILPVLIAARTVGGMIHIPDGHSFSVHVVAGMEHQVGTVVVISTCSLLFQMPLGAAGGGCLQSAPLETAANQMDDFCHAVSFPPSSP